MTDRNEFVRTVKGHESSMTMGLIPGVSIDCRIQCPRTFTEKDPPPPPPTPRYAEIATRAAFKIMAAMWFCREHAQVVKVGYTLDEQSSDNLYITGKVVLIVPTIEEKITVGRIRKIGHRNGYDGMGFALTAPDAVYDEILDRLAEEIVLSSVGAIQNRKNELDRRAEELTQFQSKFIERTKAN